MADVKVKIIVEVNGERQAKEVVRGKVNSRADLASLESVVVETVKGVANKGRLYV